MDIPETVYKWEMKENSRWVVENQEQPSFFPRELNDYIFVNDSILPWTQFFITVNENKDRAKKFWAFMWRSQK